MRLIGIGRFVKDPELKPVNDTFVCEFTLAFNEFRKVKGENKKNTCFLDFQIWDKAAELIVEYCRKGNKLLIEATPRQDKWTDADGNKRSKIFFRVDNFTFVDRPPQDENGDEEKPS